jgi:hypothetical protein
MHVCSNLHVVSLLNAENCSLDTSHTCKLDMNTLQFETNVIMSVFKSTFKKAALDCALNAELRLGSSDVQCKYLWSEKYL